MARRITVAKQVMPRRQKRLGCAINTASETCGAPSSACSPSLVRHDSLRAVQTSGGVGPGWPDGGNNHQSQYTAVVWTAAAMWCLLPALSRYGGPCS